MDHDRAVALIEQQFDRGALEAEDRRALVAHLRACEDCRAKFDALALLERGLAQGAEATKAQLAGGWRALQEDRRASRATGAEAQPTATTPKRGPHWARRRLVAMAVATVALLLLFFWPRPTSFPRYDLTVDGGEKTMLGPPEPGLLRLRPNTTVTLTLRPDIPAEDRAFASAFLVRGTDQRALALSWTRSAEGAMRYRGELIQSLDLAPGRWTLVLLVGDHAAGSVDRTTGMQRFDRPIEVLE